MYITTPRCHDGTSSIPSTSPATGCRTRGGRTAEGADPLQAQGCASEHRPLHRQHRLCRACLPPLHRAPPPPRGRGARTAPSYAHTTHQRIGMGFCAACWPDRHTRMVQRRHRVWSVAQLAWLFLHRPPIVLIHTSVTLPSWQQALCKACVEQVVPPRIHSNNHGKRASSHSQHKHSVLGGAVGTRRARQAHVFAAVAHVVGKPSQVGAGIAAQVHLYCGVLSTQ